MMLIAKEYEAMGDYNYELTYWKNLYNRFRMVHDVFEGHANLAYRMGKYEEAITSYNKALNLNDFKKSPVKISKLNEDIAISYQALEKQH